MKLSGKVLVVTGSSGALGQAVATTLSGYGARVALLDHSHSPPLVPPAGALHYGGVDLTEETAARSAMAQVAKEAGRLDGLINVAGGFRWEKLEGGTLDSWDAMYRLNLRTAVVACQAALPHLLQAGGGRIVNVGARGIEGGRGAVDRSPRCRIEGPENHRECHIAEYARYAAESPRYAAGRFQSLGDPGRGRRSHRVPGF
jgi:NAD(P)-dependent dehydrogenase (short-subunit alcohol dehydrogenase family)